MLSMLDVDFELIDAPELVDALNSVSGRDTRAVTAPRPSLPAAASEHHR
jgi:hypothetical protein